MLTTRRSLAVVAAVLSLSAVVTIGVEEHRITNLRQDDAQLAVNATNDTAAVDTTRNVAATNPELAKSLGDSLRVYQRLVIQTTQQRDAVDAELRLERRGRYALSTRLDSLQRVVASRAGVVEDSTDHIRRASFEVRQAPYTVAAVVELPPPPGMGQLDLRIKLDAIPIVARLSCAPPNEHGIRSASIEAQTPAWAAVRFGEVEQSADLCASPALAGSGRRSLFKFKPVVIGAGRIVEPNGTSRWGAFIGTGFAIGSS